jgi:shikimate kinase
VDIQVRVSIMMGMPVEDIYQRLGESFYQNAETGALMELVGETPSVISTGSEMPMVKENVQLMQNHGIIIYVERPLDQLLAERAAEIGTGSGRDELIQKYNQSVGFYRACADYVVENDRGIAVGIQKMIALVHRII